ncbi:MAG: HAMP domain-containing histidine kinase [Bacteroidales bacterium]|nr:HAMP domain-containing histidine kinase [Bacteroidales bacterium]
MQNRFKTNLVLLILAIIIGLSTIAITNKFVNQLALEERKKIDLWVSGIRELTNLTSSEQDFTFIFEVIQNNSTVPVVLTDEYNNIQGFRNVDKDLLNDAESTKRLLNKMRSEHEPIEINLSNNVKNYVYYMDSTTLKKLSYYPYIQLFIIILFILISYYAFSQSRKAEQNGIWVGMAKETAHQLGTPTSSLMACLAILRDKMPAEKVLDELEKDIHRLEVITDRFSKIGSTPKLTMGNLTETLNKSIAYLQSRLSKNVEFEKLYPETSSIRIPLNDKLIEWVIENIAKNSVDAMNGNGKLSFNIIDNTQVVFIDITDTGKGIPRSKFKDVFRPGYTTKSRGWGLGLTLSKRIIEEYHRGKIFVKMSEINKGTTFRIVLYKN